MRCAPIGRRRGRGTFAAAAPPPRFEHFNFEPTSTYHGRHIVDLSTCLPETDALYQMADDEMVAFTLEHLRRMFPTRSRGWVLAAGTRPMPQPEELDALDAHGEAGVLHRCLRCRSRVTA